MPKALVWTHKKPTERGYYWIDPGRGAGTLIRYVAFVGYENDLGIEGAFPLRLLPDDFRFAGPIAPPKEKT